VTLIHNNECRHEEPTDNSEECRKNGKNDPFLKRIVERPDAANIRSDGGEKQSEGKSLCYGNPAVELVCC
jgi:hypothetical protein